MDYRVQKIVACVNDTKDACLYFDNVVPLNLAQVIPWLNNGDLEAHEVLNQILPPTFLNAALPLGLSRSMMSYVEAYVNTYPSMIGVDGTNEQIIQRSRFFFPHLMKRKDELFATLPQPIDIIFGDEFSDANSPCEQDPSIVLTGLKLVDTSGISWKHLLEIRKDSESTRKLRRLRTFIYQNYNDKPIAFIKDDLISRIETYETIAKQLGLKTTESAFKIIFNSTSLFANTAATIFSALSGIPITVPLSLGIGSAFMLGNIGIELRSHKRDLLKFKQDSPITYLIDVKNRTK